MPITVQSFGFKYDTPIPDADIVANLRNRVSNPQAHLPRGAVGTDTIVRRAVLGPPRNRRMLDGFLKRVLKLLKAQNSVTIAFGCRSGIHRSVVFAEELGAQVGTRTTTEPVVGSAVVCGGSRRPA